MRTENAPADIETATTGELIRRMVLAHARGESDAFLVAVRALIAEERRKKHVIYARELERILANELPAQGRDVLTLFGAGFGDIPRDKDRGMDLVEVIEPRRSLSDLVLSGRVRRHIERILTENKQAELLSSRGLQPARRILFCGPPGCGKTVTAEAIAGALYLPLVLVRFDAVISSYLGETAANLRRVFEYVRDRPVVLFFDEFDAIGKQRDDPEEHGELKRVVNSFLQMLDRFRGNAITIAATNHEQLLDVAIWRRFDDVVAFRRPGPRAIEELLRTLWRHVDVAPDVEIQRLAHHLRGRSHADVERIAADCLKEVVLSGRSRIDRVVIQSSLVRETDRQRLTVRPQVGSPGVDEGAEEAGPFPR